jgi:hypothetical protein
MRSKRTGIKDGTGSFTFIKLFIFAPKNVDEKFCRRTSLARNVA